MEIPKGFCQCGCGGRTHLARCNDKSKGWIKGIPIKFLPKHSTKITRGENHPQWKGGTRLANGGYVTVLMPGHPRADRGGYVREHILICEKALGKPLPEGAEPHHVNRIPADNGPGNLVICQDHAYHMLLHQRQRALEACGHAAWRKCTVCKRYDDPANLKTMLRSRSSYHNTCKVAYNSNRLTKKQA